MFTPCDAVRRSWLRDIRPQGYADSVTGSDLMLPRAAVSPSGRPPRRSLAGQRLGSSDERQSLQAGAPNLHLMLPRPYDGATIDLVNPSNGITGLQFTHLRPGEREPLELLAREQPES